MRNVFHPQGRRRLHRVPPCRRQGFTLVEVLVALVVMSLIAGLAWQAVDGMVRTRTVVDAELDRGLRLGTALAQWEQDLQQVMTDAPVPGLHFDGSRLRIVRRTPDGPIVVVWTVGQSQWRRWVSPPQRSDSALVGQWGAAGNLLGTEPGQLTVAEGTAAWQVFFYRGASWSNAQSSGDLVAAGVAAAQGASAAGLRERLPQGVRLILSDGGSPPRTLTRDVLVPGGQP